MVEQYANHIGYSDVEPHEVVRVISDKTIEIRRMEAEELPWDKEWYAGGFAGHLANQRDQKWNITSAPEKFKVFRIRLHKNGEWRDSDGRRFRLADKPVKFYDYNF